MCDDSLLLPRESVEAQLRSCLAYRRERPDWRGRSLRLAYSLLHWWDERDAAVNDCLDRQRTIDDLRVVLAATRAALRALEQCCSWSDTMQQWTLAGRERTQPALQAARETLAKEELVLEGGRQAAIRAALELHDAGADATADRPICKACNDTHMMPLGDREVPCMRCPVPCERCRSGAYCATTPCACECHQ